MFFLCWRLMIDLVAEGKMAGISSLQYRPLVFLRLWQQLRATNSMEGPARNDRNVLLIEWKELPELKEL